MRKCFFTLLLILALSRLALPEPPPHRSNEYSPAQLKPYLEATTWVVLSLEPDPWSIRRQGDPFIVPAPAPGSKEPPPPPSPPKKELPPLPPEKDFHDYEILGQVRVTVTPGLKGVITGLDHGGQQWEGAVAGCFSPRHGLRVVKEGVTYDLLICYECMSVALYEGGKEAGQIYMAGPGAPKPTVLNAILDKAAVKRIPAHHERK